MAPVTMGYGRGVKNYFGEGGEGNFFCSFGGCSMSRDNLGGRREYFLKDAWTLSKNS